MNAGVIEAQYSINFREKEARELGERLKHRQSVNIIGVKRIGISNFLRFFLYHKDIIKTYISDNRQHLFIPIDLNDLIELDIYPFWTLTLKRIADASEASQLPQAAKDKIGSLFLNSIQSQDLFLLIDSVRQALLLIVGEGFLPTLFFIRFDRIAEVFTPSFFDNLQGLRDATHQELSYVFTSFRSLNSIFPAAKTSLSVFAQIIYMRPAVGKDMRIIYETYKHRYNFHLNSAIEHALFDMVNGNVQYLQLALIILAEKKNGGVKTKEELFQTLVHDERITLQSEELWESITKDEKRALAKILKNEIITPEEKEKNIYLWDTGFVMEQKNKDMLFSPLFKEYLDGREKEDNKIGPVIHLTRKEHMLFTLLESHIGNICEREEIIEIVWPEYKELGVSDWAIDRLVARVRVKLKQQNSPYEIVTVRTRGYKLSAIKE
ncbi:helix-turn-helix domain-containing protein [Patescibacteria group bacterium]|nr:helix-turn-helix domain-containing protein [Patescibacteria group bacterium]